VFRHAEHVMGTVFSIEVRDPRVEPAVLGRVVRRLHEIDACYSTYRDDSLISKLGRDELMLIDAPAEIQWVLTKCEQWRKRTDGWFDVRATGRLDPSGYVKGWAIHQASDLLRSAGSRSHCVNGGGDIQATGSDKPWRFGIVDPTDSTRILATVAGPTLAVATSGTAERGRHIYDPATHRPAADALLSLSVIGRSIIECDVLATVGVAMGDAAEIWFAGRPNVQTFGVRADGGTFTTGATAAN